jgi:hypothetical protein
MKSILTILLLILFSIPLKAELKWLRKLSHNEGVATVLQAVDSNNVFAFVEGDLDATKVFRSSDQGDTWTKLYEYHPWNGSELDSLNGINHCFALDTNNIYITYGYKIALEKSTDGGKHLNARHLANFRAVNMKMN